jgi:hypothetical protein
MRSRSQLNKKLGHCGHRNPELIKRLRESEAERKIVAVCESRDTKVTTVRSALWVALLTYQYLASCGLACEFQQKVLVELKQTRVLVVELPHTIKKLLENRRHLLCGALPVT